MGTFSLPEKKQLQDLIVQAQEVLDRLTAAEADVLSNETSAEEALTDAAAAQVTATGAQVTATGAQATAELALEDKMEGPPSSTDSAVARFSGTGGTTIKNSSVIIDDSGNVTGVGTVDGRDLATDGSKLDGIEAAADVTDTANVLSGLAAASGDVDVNGQAITNVGNVDGRDLSTDGSKLDGITAGASIGGGSGTFDNNIVRADGSGGSTVQGSLSFIDDSGNITCGTINTRNVVNDGNKLDGIEAGAEVNLVKEYWSGYDTTGGVTLTTAATVTIDTVLKTSGATFTLASGELQIDKTGTYAVTIDFTGTEGTSSRATCEAWLEEDSGGFAEVTGSRCLSYVRENTGQSSTGSATVILDITSGDSIRMRAQRTVGTVANSQTMADRSRLTVIEL